VHGPTAEEVATLERLATAAAAAFTRLGVCAVEPFARSDSLPVA
jgi:hypothetical protein